MLVLRNLGMDIGRAEEQHKQDNSERMPSDKKNETVAIESVKVEEKKELKGGQDENRREKEKREEGTEEKPAPAEKIAEEEPNNLERTKDEEEKTPPKTPQQWWNVFILLTVVLCGLVVWCGFIRIWMKPKTAAAYEDITRPTFLPARMGAVSSRPFAAPTQEQRRNPMILRPKRAKNQGNIGLNAVA